MTNNDLLKQLNNLKDIKPDPDWKKTNRGILVNQIFGPETKKTRYEFSWAKIIGERLPLQALRNVSQPAMVVVLVLIFLAGSGVLSIKAAQNTKPGDSLYIAKIVSEKAHLALTFDEREKARLGISFAGNRARELGQVMSQPDNEPAKQAAMEKLVSDFKKEIDGVKTHLAKISPEANKAAVAEDQGAPAGEEPAAEEPAAEEGDMPVFSANAEKDNQGIELSEPSPETTAPSEPSVSAPESMAMETPGEATSSAGEGEAATAGEETTAGDPQEILNQAESFLNNDDYDGTIKKLDEADRVISRVNETQIREGSERRDDEPDAATTTEEGVITEGIDNQAETDNDATSSSNINITDEEGDTGSTTTQQ